MEDKEKKIGALLELIKRADIKLLEDSTHDERVLNPQMDEKTAFKARLYLNLVRQFEDEGYTIVGIRNNGRGLDIDYLGTEVITSPYKLIHFVHDHN